MTKTYQSIELQAWLPSFLADYQNCKKSLQTKKSELQTWLPQFFADYHACRTPLLEKPPELKSFKVDASELNSWFAAIAQPMVDARKGAFQFDPWEVAGLGKDEVRNSAVLGWLLNPKGSHGLGDTALIGLLGELRGFDSSFPVGCSPLCRVRVESNPDGNRASRIDIEIDDANFYVLIEVKIGACEGKEQLQRYGDISKKLAGSRPWALVFLTPGGSRSNTAGTHIDHVFPISWRRLAISMKKSIVFLSAAASPLAGPRQVSAEQAVQRFLKKMRNF